MELEDVQSDLQALKKLYGLLQFKGNNPQKNSASPNLDEKAKLVLKKLLDGATKQIISEEQQSVTKTLVEDVQSKLQSLVPPDTLSNTFSPVYAIPKDSDKDINFNPITSQTLKRCRVCGKSRDRDHRRHRNSSDHHHEVSSSSSTRPPPIKRLEWKESAKGIDQSKKPKLNKIHVVKCSKEITGSQEMWFKSEPAEYNSFEQNENKKTVADFVQRVGSRAKGLDPTKDKDLIATKHKSDMVKDGVVVMSGPSQDSRPVGVAEAIQRIEASIRANQQMLTQRVVDSVKDKKAIESKHQASKMSRLHEMKDGSTQKNIPSHLASERDRNHKEANNTLPAKTVTSHTRNNLPSRSMSEIGKTEEATSTMDQKPYRFIAGMNDLPIQKDGRAKKSVMHGPGQTRKPVRVRNDLPSHMTSLTNKSVIERVTSPSQKNQKTKESTLPTQILSQTNTKTRVSQTKTGPSSVVTSVLPRVLGPTLLKQDLVGPPQKKDLTRKTKQRRPPLDANHKPRRRREYDVPRQHIILPTLLDGTHGNVQLGPPKKLMAHQQNHRRPTSISSESASYSTASGSTTQEGSSSSSCSESDSDPQPRRMMTHNQTGPTSRYRSPNVGQTRERPRPVEHDQTVGPSRHAGTTAITRSSNRKGSEREVGRLRRLKNKLGIIFHHHHHHHHHHHDADDMGTTPEHRSFWKYLGDMLHHRTSSRDNGRRSTVKSTPLQNQQHGYLHTLVDGFIRHVRHSKKSNKSAADMKRLGKNGSRKKKKAVVKKWHWWQKLYRRGNSSNSGKTRVKVGFRAKRPLLRAPKPN